MFTVLELSVVHVNRDREDKFKRINAYMYHTKHNKHINETKSLELSSRLNLVCHQRLLSNVSPSFENYKELDDT